MSDPAIILGTFEDARPVKTRKVVQIIIEVPIEKHRQIHEALGYYDPSKSTWVSVARLTKEAAALAAKAEKVEDKPDKTPFKDLPASKQFWIACDRPDFQELVLKHYSVPHMSLHLPAKDKAAAALKNFWSVESSKDFDTDPEAAEQWKRFYTYYEQETGRLAKER